MSSNVAAHLVTWLVLVAILLGMSSLAARQITLRKLIEEMRYSYANVSEELGLDPSLIRALSQPGDPETRHAIVLSARKCESCQNLKTGIEESLGVAQRVRFVYEDETDPALSRLFRVVEPPSYPWLLVATGSGAVLYQGPAGSVSRIEELFASI